MRSRRRIRTSPKRHFTDPSLAAAALGARPEMLMRDTWTAGFRFESLCYRDLSVYASASGGGGGAHQAGRDCRDADRLHWPVMFRQIDPFIL
ncbi:MAG: DUF4143 domain-containing protein [Candidatus Methanoplasma sp.]|nr:DUF4143 domain-containing protein [Candidatus Methanoplasma sp.]